MPTRRRIFVCLWLLMVCVCAIYLGSLDIRLLYQIFPAALLVGLGIGLVIYALRLKKALIAALSSPNRRAAHPDEFPLLDKPELERLTREWEELGFVQCGDFTSSGSSITAFTRLFEQESAGAITELTQQFLPNKALLFGASVTSLWGAPEARSQVEHMAQGLDETANSTAPLASPTSAATVLPTLEVDELPLWMLMTHNHAPTRYSALFRQPHVLAARLPPNSSSAYIWQQHLKRRALVQARLDLPLLEGELPALLYASGRVISALIVKRLDTTPLWKLMPYRFARDSSVPTHYDGELAPLEK